MLRTRLWMGSLLIALAVLLLLEDRWFAPRYPLFFICYVAAGLVATRELLDLLPAAVRPAEALTMVFVCVVAGFNWWPAFLATRDVPPGIGVWDLIGACVLIGFASAFVYEMWRFRGPERITERLALTA